MFCLPPAVSCARKPVSKQICGDTGIGLYVFSGRSHGSEPTASNEGVAEWVPYERVAELPVVEDLPILLAEVHKLQRGDPPFSARSFYDENQRLILVFAD
jgi:hypothetical protein